MSAGPLNAHESSGALFRRWLLWVSIGESAGFLVPVLAQWAGSGIPAVSTPLLVLAGAGEGAVLGAAGAHVLRSRFPGFPAGRWIGATAAAAAFAWFLGLLPSTFASTWTAWPAPAIVAGGALLGVLLLCSIGFAQWLVLRRNLPRSRRWIVGSAAAWCVGLAVFFAVATPLWQPGQSAPLIVAIGVLAGVLMAVSMAATTGLVLLGLLRDARRGTIVSGATHTIERMSGVT